MTPEQHLAFGRLFGELHLHPAAPHEPGQPELMIIQADENSPRANGEGWHTDVSCDVEPPMGSILYIKKCPPKGGDTLFASMYAAYEALSDRMKTYLDGLTAVHDGESVYRGLFKNFGVADKAALSARRASGGAHPSGDRQEGALRQSRLHPRPGRRAARRERRHPALPLPAHGEPAVPVPLPLAARTRSPSGTIAASSTARCGTTGRTPAAATASRWRATSRTDLDVLVIFDCDGVLVDSEPLANASFSRALKAQGLDWSVEETMRRLMGLSLKSALEIVEAELGRKLPDDFFEKMQAVTYQSFRDAPLQPVAGVKEAVQALQAAGLATCVASSGSPEKMRFTLGLTGLWDLFDGRIFSSSQVPRGKPFPDLFLHARPGHERAALRLRRRRGFGARHPGGPAPPACARSPMPARPMLNAPSWRQRAVSCSTT